jgi:hypothetical protein
VCAVSMRRYSPRTAVLGRDVLLYVALWAGPMIIGYVAGRLAVRHGVVEPTDGCTPANWSGRAAVRSSAEAEENLHPRQMSEPRRAAPAR